MQVILKKLLLCLTYIPMNFNITSIIGYCAALGTTISFFTAGCKNDSDKKYIGYIAFYVHLVYNRHIFLAGLRYHEPKLACCGS